MDLDAYLERIGYRGTRDASGGTLRAVHVAHLEAVPFENLSIHWGEPIELDLAALYEKIVVRRRGGFCYELNGLFAWLLRELGFDVTMLSGRVARPDGTFGEEFDHMALRVDEQWLADVGFGESFREPLRLDVAGEQHDPAGTFRIVDGLLEHLVDGAWRPEYRFSLTPRAFEEYRPMCVWQQTSPESHFTKRRIASRATPDGRITIADRRLIRTTLGHREEIELADDSAVAQALRDELGIVR